MKEPSAAIRDLPNPIGISPKKSEKKEKLDKAIKKKDRKSKDFVTSFSVHQPADSQCRAPKKVTTLSFILSNINMSFTTCNFSVASK